MIAGFLERVWRITMDDEQLAALEQGMRAMLTDFGLDWVRENIEERIAAGKKAAAPYITVAVFRSVIALQLSVARGSDAMLT